MIPRFHHYLWPILFSLPVAAEDGQFPELSWHGVLDLRYQHSDATPGDLQQGLGKLRNSGERDRWRVNEAAVTAQWRLDWDWMATATLKYADRQSTPLDLSEAFIGYRPVADQAWRWSARLGLFFPPISLENTGTAWSSPYTLNSSLINSWVGEELRSIGGELRGDYQTDSGQRIGLFAATLAANDTTGLMLAWRGWGLSDFESTLNSRWRLPNSVDTQRLFPLQAATSRPFVEVDGRPGYYAGLNLEQGSLGLVRLLYYDNNADPAAIEAGQYAWHSRFWSLSSKVELPGQFTLITQGLNGRTQMGELSDGLRAVDSEFWAASLLLSRPIGDGRLSVRYERFAAGQRDYFPQDDNREHGQAWTVNYNVTLAQQHQINVEYSRILSNRAARAGLGLDPYQEESLWQVAYRWFF